MPKHDDEKIVSPEGRYWPGRGPEGEDVVMLTGKHYPASILDPDFLERCLEDGIVSYLEEKTKHRLASVASEKTPEPKTGTHGAPRSSVPEAPRSSGEEN